MSDIKNPLLHTWRQEKGCDDPMYVRQKTKKAPHKLQALALDFEGLCVGDQDYLKLQCRWHVSFGMKFAILRTLNHINQQINATQSWKICIQSDILVILRTSTLQEELKVYSSKLIVFWKDFFTLKEMYVNLLSRQSGIRRKRTPQKMGTRIYRHV